MKILAFLQNMWVRDPERVRELIARDGEVYRRRLLSYALFAGCLTGRRLQETFGNLCDEIVWENVTKEVTGSPSAKITADRKHVSDRIREEDPEVIIVFGEIARDAIAQVRFARMADVESVHVIHAPHPAARHALVTSELRRAADELRELMAAEPTGVQ